MNTHTHSSRAFFALLGILILIMSLGGCQRWNKVDMTQRIEGVPPIMIETLSEHYLIVMRAPNSGWDIQIEKDERIRDGVRLYVTVRRPDPALMYPQAIVDKRVLTQIRTDNTIEIAGRLLDAHETTKGKGFAPIEPVDAFED